MSGKGEVLGEEVEGDMLGKEVQRRGIRGNMRGRKRCSGEDSQGREKC
jgi:hypothetical protein